MSEIQDGIAVLEMSGRFFVGSLKLVRGLGRIAIDLMAAILAYEHTHHQPKGCIDFSKLMKRTNGDYGLLRFPEGLDEKQKEDISDRLKKMGIAYAWAPVFEKKPYEVMAIDKKDAGKVSIILEDYAVTSMGLSEYVQAQDPDCISEEISNMIHGEYENMRTVIDVGSSDISSQLNHYTEREYPHTESWIMFDKDNPNNYISMKAELSVDPDGNTYTKTNYITYRDKVEIGRYSDERYPGRPKGEWTSIKKRMAAEIGVDMNYQGLFTVRKNAPEFLEAYQEKFTENKRKREKVTPEEADQMYDEFYGVAAKTIKVPSSLCLHELGEDIPLYYIVEIDINDYFKLPTNMVTDIDHDQKILQLPKKIRRCDPTGMELKDEDGNNMIYTAEEVFDKLQELSQKKNKERK